MPLNTAVYHRALGAAHAGHVSEAEPLAGEANSIGAYPVLTDGGKVSSQHVDKALAIAQSKGEAEFIEPLQRLSDAIHGRDAQNLSRAHEVIGQLADRIADIDAADCEALNLSRAPRLSKCPGCGSHDVVRLDAATEHEGPMDQCSHCQHTWAHKPGTITAGQYVGQQEPEPSPEEESPLEEENAERLADSGRESSMGIPTFQSNAARGFFSVM